MKTEIDNDLFAHGGVEDGLLLAAGHQLDDAAVALSTRAAHALHQPHRRLVRVVANDQVDVADIQPLLADARRNSFPQNKKKPN